MKLSRAAAGVSFLGALAIGLGVAAFFVAATETEPPTVTVTYRLTPMPVDTEVPVTAENLVGTWTGVWDHARVRCTITIDRVNGNTFYGTLYQEGARIAFAGTIDSSDRRIFFRENKILHLGEYGEWSLGTNSGGFSADGRTLSGTGIDKWGTYQWSVTKE